MPCALCATVTFHNNLDRGGSPLVPLLITSEGGRVNISGFICPVDMSLAKQKDHWWMCTRQCVGINTGCETTQRELCL